MHLLTWNLNNARAVAACRRLTAALRPDVLFLQEAPAAVDTFVNWLWRAVPGNRWGSAIAVASGRIEEVPVAGYDGWVIGGRWHQPHEQEGRPRYLFSVHSPTSREGRKRRSYVQESRAIVQEISDAVGPDAELWIGGDFNFTSFGERQPTESVQTKPDEREALRHFAGLGLVPAWSSANPKAPLAQTIRWTRDPKMPFHCDGFLVRPSISERIICEVLGGPVITGASDHSPVGLWVL